MLTGVFATPHYRDTNPILGADKVQAIDAVIGNTYLIATSTLAARRQRDAFTCRPGWFGRGCV